MRLRLMILCVSALLLCAATVIAGFLFGLKCNNSKCSYTPEVNIGGGFTFSQVQGYCVKCEDFVSITWEHDAASPESAGKVWLPSTGKEYDLYQCPKCRSPFLQITAEEMFKAIGGTNQILCPRCTNGVLTVNTSGHYD